MTSMPASLTEADRAALAAGRHADVARDLLARGCPAEAAWVYEQIWDWDAAWSAYQAARAPLDALRVALDAGSGVQLDRTMRWLEQEPAAWNDAVALLKKRRRPLEAARLQALSEDPRAQAESLIEGGDALEAARVLADRGHAQEALELLRRSPALQHASGLALLARVAWDLGDAEGAARAAQRSLRAMGDRPERPAVQELLARALVALGHDLAAQIVLRGRALGMEDVGLPGRYQVQGFGPPGLVGAAYLGIDRVTLEEVEIHLLLAEHTESGGTLEPDLVAALQRFARTAVAAAQLGHPAIRPIRRVDPRAGLLVLPRAEGPSLRSLVRPPGLSAFPSRARALVAFLLEGLAAAHARGLVHGWLLPSQIVCDAAGRPMLGPFGAHHLAGLAATRTGSLEEILWTTAPEVRAGAAPHVGSDLYAVGALLWALLVGEMSLSARTGDPRLRDLPEVELAQRLLADDPAARPSLDAALAILRSRVAHVRELEWTEPGSPRTGVRDEGDAGPMGPGVPVVAAASWSDALLDELCRRATSFMQPILDREGRTVRLAPWPEGSHTLGEDVVDWQALVSPDAIPSGDPLEAAIRQRMRPAAIVRTPCGQWMIALDDVLTR